MPTFSPLLLIVPSLMAALFCIAGKVVHRGSAPVQDVERLDSARVWRWEMVFDMLMVAGMASFIMFIDEHVVRSSQIFLYGLTGLSVVSIVLVGVANALGPTFSAVLLRKVAFRTILCLALFTVVLGMRAAGIGHTDLREDELVLRHRGG